MGGKCICQSMLLLKLCVRYHKETSTQRKSAGKALFWPLRLAELSEQIYGFVSKDQLCVENKRLYFMYKVIDLI